jgi:hypothetical protein
VRDLQAWSDVLRDSIHLAMVVDDLLAALPGYVAAAALGNTKPPKGEVRGFASLLESLQTVRNVRVAVKRVRGER